MTILSRYKNEQCIGKTGYKERDKKRQNQEAFIRKKEDLAMYCT